MQRLVSGPEISCKFTKSFPNAVIFAGNWPVHLPRNKESFTVQQLGDFKFVALKRNGNGGTIGFVQAPASLPPKLGRFHPWVIFTTQFSIWTVCFRPA